MLMDSKKAIEYPPGMSAEDVASNARLRDLSGGVDYPSSDYLTGLFYYLLRDAAPGGELERIVRELERCHARDGGEGLDVYTNGWIARYAKDLADRVRALEVRTPSPG